MPLLSLHELLLSFNEGADNLGDLVERAAVGGEDCSMLDLGFAEGGLCSGDAVDGCSDACRVAVGHCREDSRVGRLCPEVGHLVSEGGDLGADFLQLAHRPSVAQRRRGVMRSSGSREAEGSEIGRVCPGQEIQT